MNPIELASILLQAGVILTAAVWAVSKIVRQSAVMNESIRHLSENVGRLSKTVDRVDKRLDTHERRIIRLEEQGNHGQAV